jgi:hypothetical protein
MKEVKKPSIVPVQVPGNEGGAPKTPISEQTNASYGYLQFQFKSISTFILVNCGAADFVDVLHASLPFFEHFLGGGRLKSRFYQSCRSNPHFYPIFQVTHIYCSNMSSTSYQSSFHGDFIGISCRRDTQPSRPGAVTRRRSFKPRALMRRSRNCYRISSCSWAKSGLKHDQYCIIIINCHYYYE